AALYAREKTGQGCHVQIAMLDVMLAFLWPLGMASETLPGQEPASRSTEKHSDLIFRTADGYVAVAPVTDPEWRAFCGAVARPDLEREPRFATITTRAANAAARNAAMQEI